MIQFKKQPGQRILELGGGESRHPQADVMVDSRPLPTVDFQWDLSEFPWPLADDEFDAVYCAFCLEHVSYTKVREFLKETFRVTKPGGQVVFLLPDTDAQTRWIRDNPHGWDGKNLFDAASDVLFGAQSYTENTHKSYWNADLAKGQFLRASFSKVEVQPFNPRGTDLVVTASKPSLRASVTNLSTLAKASQTPSGYGVDLEEPGPVKQLDDAVPDALPPALAPGSFRPNVEGTQFRSKERDGKMWSEAPTLIHVDRGGGMGQVMTPEQAFDKRYFNGGGFVGGYAREGYRDFPVHEVTARHVLARKPESVLELGCARGYVLKRIQDAGVPGWGLEVSKHCYLTRVCENISQHDLCQTPWPRFRDAVVVGDHLGHCDLCYSVATLEHVPEQHLPVVIQEMARVSKRGLHGVDFGEKDDGFDKTHCTLHDKEWWLMQFTLNAPGYPVEVVNKEDLERGDFPHEVAVGDGKIKLNVGSFTTMFHHGWVNVDQHDLAGFAQQNGYKYQRHDVRQGLPYDTGSVDLIFSSHFLEHLSYADGLRFLKECRRVLKPDTGALRLVVPDAALLAGNYFRATTMDIPEYQRFWKDEDEINDEAAAAPTTLGKLWALLCDNHHAAYDFETLSRVVQEAGFFVVPDTAFRHTECEHVVQILRETTEMGFGLSLFFDAVPQVG